MASTNLRPEIFNVPYESAQHRHLLTAIRQRVKMSRDKFSTVFARYAEDEEAYRAYIRPSDNDAIRNNLKQQGKPQFVTVYVPYTLAILWAMHTYWSSVFLGRTPVWQLTARHAEPHKHVMGMEAILDYQVYVGRHVVPYFLWLMDAGKYGRGIVGTYWAEDYAIRTRVIEEPVTFLGIQMDRTKKKKITERIPGYTGNKIYNVRPQDWLPDPRVPTHRFQDGEF